MTRKGKEKVSGDRGKLCQPMIEEGLDCAEVDCLYRGSSRWYSYFHRLTYDLELVEIPSRLASIFKPKSDAVANSKPTTKDTSVD